MALDWFRGWGFSWYQPWRTASCTHPSPPTGEPAQVAPGRALSIIPKPEMEAGAYLGGGGKKPDLGLEVRRCHRKYSSSGLSSTGWRSSQGRRGWSLASHPSFPTFSLGVSGQVADGRNPVLETQGFKPGASEEKPGFPTKNKPTLFAVSLPSRVRWIELSTRRGCPEALSPAEKEKRVEAEVATPVVR